jgi:exodeoxyribonuclease VII small subunit
VHLQPGRVKPELIPNFLAGPGLPSDRDGKVVQAGKQDALTGFGCASNVTPDQNTRDDKLLAKRTSKTPDFETALAELEALVEKMEQGDLTLDDSLKQFERGVQLTRSCQQALKDAEQKVQVLMEKDGQASLEPFEDDAAT